MDSLIPCIFMLLLLASTASTEDTETTLDFFASASAILFTVLFGRSTFLRKDDSILKRLLNLEDISTTIANPVQPSSFAGRLWNDPYVRVVSALTIFGLAAQIFGMPYGYTTIKRRKRHIKGWPW